MMFAPKDHDSETDDDSWPDPPPMVRFTDDGEVNTPDDQGPRKIVVSGAGHSAVNGVYFRDGL